MGRRQVLRALGALVGFGGVSGSGAGLAAEAGVGGSARATAAETQKAAKQAVVQPATGSSGVDAGETRVWLDAKFLAPGFSQQVPDAERTVYAAGRWDGMELRAFTRAEWEDWRRGGGGGERTWEACISENRARAERDLERVRLVYERDKRKVVQSVELSCERPLVCSAVLAPSLGERLADAFGDEFFLSVPNRGKAFVFPKFAGDLSRFAARVWEAYRETAYPVSYEVLEWRRGALRAVGAFEP